MTFPVAYKDHASSKNFPVDLEFGMFGKTLDADKGEKVRNVDYTEYEEGIYVGYRWFDKAGIEVSYPFGYGLSYTEFEYGSPAISHSAGVTKMTVTVTNTGNSPARKPYSSMYQHLRTQWTSLYANSRRLPRHAS